MDNKGFTLIELIATIALLAIISVISFVSITGVINQSKVNECESIVSTIKSAVKEYVSDNRYGNVFSGTTVTISGNTLLSGKYLSGAVIEPFNDQDITSSISIKVELNSDYTVKNINIEAPSILKNCESGI